MIEYSLIAAVSDNWVIGNGSKIPWYIPEDFKLFKESTLENIVIMGRTTWESLPEKFRPLPNRINIVVTSNSEYEVNGAIICTSLEEAFEKASGFEDKKIFVIGGAKIYEQTISDATHLYISHVKGEFEGDILFPKFDKSDYEVIEEKEFEKFIFRKYKKLISNS